MRSATSEMFVVQSVPARALSTCNFNVQDPELRDPRIRQAIAYAIDRPALIAALWRGHAHIANTLLPPGHWAAASDTELAQYQQSAARRGPTRRGGPQARQGRHSPSAHIEDLDRRDNPPGGAGHAAELRDLGIELSLRSTEFGTFYSDITQGAFQMYMLRWIGSNEDPGFLRYAIRARASRRRAATAAVTQMRKSISCSRRLTLRQMKQRVDATMLKCSRFSHEICHPFRSGTRIMSWCTRSE